MSFPYKIVDLTHTLDPTIPSWTGGCAFNHEIKLDYEQCTTNTKFRVQQLKMHAGVGTHMDAPAHCIVGGKSIDELDINNFIAPCIVIDVSDKAHENYIIGMNDIKSEILAKSFVMFKTGWEKFWSEPRKYHNNHVFPSVSGEVAKYLVDKDIVGIGIDTLSPDAPKNGFLVHETILGAGKYIIENAANLDSLPINNSFIMAFPIKSKGCTESPIRLVGLVSKVSCNGNGKK